MTIFLPTADDDEALAVAELLRLPRFGSGPGLHRMLYLTQELADSSWYGALDSIRVTGSKGKGSVSAMIAAILHVLGVRTGLYTSPHLARFSERIQVDGSPIDGGSLLRHTRSALTLVESYRGQYPQDRIGAFEVFTAIAIQHFAQCAVGAVVSEAGIGGRYDPTRAIPGRIVALTSVELEHTALLGNSTDLIACDKSDLCPAAGTLLVGRIDSDVLRRLRGYCTIRGCHVLSINDIASVSQPTYHDGEMQFDLICRELNLTALRMRLMGPHQAWNAALAVATVQGWVATNRRACSDASLEAAVRAGLREVEWPGRLEWIKRNPDVVIDVGHTPESAKCIADSVRDIMPGRKLLLVTGVSTDKNARGILGELVPPSAGVVCTRAYHHGSSVDAIAAICEEIKPNSVWRCAATIEEALELAIERAARDDMLVLVAGGLFLAVEAANYLQGGNPQSLRFF
jgi:dihydrofolate synthase/folylpolyglutamate synthase